jgi:hypothetical protein
MVSVQWLSVQFWRLYLLVTAALADLHRLAHRS